MANAQVARTHKAFGYGGLAELNYYISLLRSKITTGSIIYGSDIQNLINMVNAALGHYHTYDDLYQIATYGNNGDRNTYTRDSNTYRLASSITGGTPSDIGGITTTSSITAAKHNEMAGGTRAYGNHFHSIDDRAS